MSNLGDNVEKLDMDNMQVLVDEGCFLSSLDIIYNLRQRDIWGNCFFPDDWPRKNRWGKIVFIPYK